MQLGAYLQSLDILTEKEIADAIPFFYPEILTKGTHYLNAGQICDKISFVEQGLFRLYYQLDGKERIMLFFAEGQFMSDYFGFLTQSPSIRPIQALEKSLVYSITQKDLDSLFASSKNWECIGRLLAQQAYVSAVLRANRLLHDDYDTRYATFVAENPGLVQRVPQYMLAAYLNMTPETLSRVKRRAAKPANAKDSVHKTISTHFLI